MDSPMLKVTIQAALLNALSNTLAQLITCYRTNTSYALNYHDLAAFVTFSLIASPPNYIWQTWLEASFPGYAGSLTPKEKEKLVDEVVAGRSSGVDNGVATIRNEKKLAMTTSSTTQDPVKAKRKLDLKNTAIKFLLDQTVGAAANTILFIIGIAILQGRSFDQGIAECREGFWPLIRAGQRLWPLVSLINLTLVPVEQRMIFGSIVGVFWGIFLSLMSSGKKTKTS
ncbi:hypothetical protein AMS68_000070 [Peltaster fructicola]|uniref:Uncharacterized protein n=1 Tax=Peltaster fructicola TaxID=286661 RepID=A0A6H0XIK1_9PEZI|nr:hypothetical protein AMS68_000070 [Peltaster fructicola]